MNFEIDRTPSDPNNNLIELPTGPPKENSFALLMKKTIELPHKPKPKSCEQGKEILIETVV